METLSKDEVLAIRQRMGATQEQMAALVGVHVRTWTRWELGEIPVPTPAAKLLARLESE